MAVTKIHPIKSTLKKALDYIANPAKTDDKLYMLEVMYAIAEARGYSIAELEAVRRDKAAERGGFRKCIYLDGVETGT